MSTPAAMARPNKDTKMTAAIVLAVQSHDEDDEAAYIKWMIKNAVTNGIYIAKRRKEQDVTLI